MKRTKIKELLDIENPLQWVGKNVMIAGWVRTVRAQKNFFFVEINDGSFFNSLQILSDQKEDLTIGCSVSVEGTVVESPGKNQSIEIKASHILIHGTSDVESYPLQKKRHSFEFLRTIAHLRPRTNTQSAVARVRNRLAFATHQFFQDKGFIYVQTPIITGSDCEGSGEMFRVTTQKDSKDVQKDFFQKPAYLTVSGQLEAETYACALSDVYTFGPTFRAENSHTSRHLAEFWMIEPEMAFCDLKTNIDIAEEYLKYLIDSTLKDCTKDLEFFDRFIEKNLLQRLDHVRSTSFIRISYTEAIEILNKSGKKFEFPCNWGADLQSEHERFLTEEHFKKPVVLTDYPSTIKAFYMRENKDQKTVAAMDILVPKIGELIGGSQREERLHLLQSKIQKMDLQEEDYWWYLDLRKYGTVPHSGFGLGFERLVQFITGMENIRDVIAFPRYPGHVDF